MGGVDLDGISVFAGLTAEDRQRAAALARELRWEAGHVALGEGEFAFDFYAIRHGAMEVLRDGHRIATLGEGDFFGEIGLVGDASRRRSATVVAIEPTEAIAIAGSDLRRLTGEIPALREALDGAAAQRSQK